MKHVSLRHAIALAALILLPGLLIVSCKNEQPSAPAQNNTISGIARDEQGYIVPSALVEALDAQSSRIASDSTDEFGLFSLANMPADRSALRIRVTQPDFKTFSAPLQSVTGSGSNGAVVLLVHQDSACGRLKLTITELANHSPIAGAEVRLRRNGTLVTTVTSDNTGIVEFNYLMAGTYSLRIAKTGFKVIERTATVQFCDSTSLDIRMEPAGNDQDSCCHGILSVLPKGAGNTVIIGALVRLSIGTTVVAQQTTTGNGAIFDGLCPGTYGVRISKDAFQVKELSVTLGCNQSLTIDPALEAIVNNDSCCHGVLTVLPQGGTPPALLVGASVRLTKGGALIGDRTVGTNGAIFDGLCPGSYGLRITKGDQFKVKELEITLGCNETRTTDPTLETNASNDSCCHGTIQFTIVDSTTRAALNGASVRLWKGSTLIATQTTGAENRGTGIVLFPNRCDGQYQVSISRDGYTSREFGFTIGCNETYTHTLGLLVKTVDSCHTAILKVRVKDSTFVDAGWLSGVNVTVAAGGMVYATGTTDVEGWFEAGSLTAPLTYIVTFTKSGFQSKTVQFTFNECKTIQETIRLAP